MYKNGKIFYKWNKGPKIEEIFKNEKIEEMYSEKKITK